MIVGLRTPDRVVGLVAIEHRAPDRITSNDAELFARIASSLALAVDNARWFGRLRTLGAEAERARIARDLHDRTAQSLAYIGFELDRLVEPLQPTPRCPSCTGSCARSSCELRETLYQLRTTVTEEEGFVPLAEPYLKRWSDRTGIDAHFEADTSGSSPAAASGAGAVAHLPRSAHERRAACRCVVRARHLGLRRPQRAPARRRRRRGDGPVATQPGALRSRRASANAPTRSAPTSGSRAPSDRGTTVLIELEATS